MPSQRQRLTPEERERRERMQARVGLASNTLGIAAGVAATGEALTRDDLEHAGRTGRFIRRVGEKIPSPIRDRARRNPKLAGKLALGAIALQGANLGGDLVARTVLERGAKKPERSKSVDMGNSASVGKSLLFDDSIEKSQMANGAYKAITQMSRGERGALRNTINNNRKARLGAGAPAAPKPVQAVEPAKPSGGRFGNAWSAMNERSRGLAQGAALTTGGAFAGSVIRGMGERRNSDVY